MSYTKTTDSPISTLAIIFQVTTYSVALSRHYMALGVYNCSTKVPSMQFLEVGKTNNLGKYRKTKKQSLFRLVGFLLLETVFFQVQEQFCCRSFR